MNIKIFSDQNIVKQDWKNFMMSDGWEHFYVGEGIKLEDLVDKKEVLNPSKISHKLVLIEWVDSYGCTAHWGEIEDKEPVEHRCYSVGWLVKENENALVVVPHISPENKDIYNLENGCGDMTIPRCSVKSIRYLN